MIICVLGSDGTITCTNQNAEDSRMTGISRCAVNRDEQDTRASATKCLERIDGPRLSQDETAVDRGLPRTMRQ